MINKQEFVKVTIVQEYNSNNGILLYTDRLSDITLDLDKVLAFNHYINPANGNLRNDLTEVILSVGTPILVKMTYNEFKALIP